MLKISGLVFEVMALSQVLIVLKINEHSLDNV